MAQPALYSPYRFKERMLLFGGGGAGKTNAILSVMRKMPYAHFWIVDTDISFAYERMLALDFDDVYQRGNFTLAEVNEWSDYDAAITRVLDKGEPLTDWLVVDDVSWTWQAVQDEIIREMYGEDKAQHFINIKKGAADMKEYMAQVAQEGNWGHINSEYTAKFYRRFHKWHGHVILTAGADNVGRNDDDMTKQTFGFLGIKPKGQKDLFRSMHTNLYLNQAKLDEWKMTTAKDRGRPRVAWEVVDDFAMDYLRDIAGWQLRPYKG